MTIKGILARSSLLQSIPKPDRRSWLLTAQVLWIITAISAVLIIAFSIPGYTKFIAEPTSQGPIEASSGFVAVLHVFSLIGSVATALMAFSLAVFLYWRKRDDFMALFVSWYLLMYSALMAGPLEAFLQSIPGTNPNLAYQLQQLFMSSPTFLLFALFPNGRFVPSWMRWLVMASGILFPVALWLVPGVWIASRDPLSSLIAVLSIILILFGAFAQIHRYRHVSSLVERQQTKWFIYGFLLAFILGIISSISWVNLENQSSGAVIPWWAPISQLSWFLMLAIIPICLAVAVLKFHLWDVDLLLNRTLVYGSLTALVAGLYIFVVTLLSMVFHNNDNLLISLLATVGVAVAFQPLRERLQRAVNRMMYGKRDDPYSVLSHLGKRMKAVITPVDLLPTIAETIAQTLKLPYVSIAFQGDRDEEVVAAYGSQPAGDLVRLPLSYQGETVGQLLISPRSPGEAFSPAEVRLLEDIAHQSGAAVYSVRVNADLQHSREKLVLAREEERRRLRRDLHDGLGATLAALNLQMGALRSAIEPNETTGALITEMRQEIHQAITDIRQLVYNLRPPALDELGLLASLQQQVTRYERAGLQVCLQAPDQLPALPAAVEVAIYRIVQEALANVAHHARAKECVIVLELSQDIYLEIRDNGIGITPEHTSGVGLQSMRERAAELGGTSVVESTGSGTHVLVHLPWMKE